MENDKPLKDEKNDHIEPIEEMRLYCIDNENDVVHHT